MTKFDVWVVVEVVSDNVDTRVETGAAQRGCDLCIPVNELDRTEHPMHATAQDLTDLYDDLRLVTLPEAARFLCVSRGTLYDLLTSGQLPSVHIGRARRVPMGERCRVVRELLERDTLRVR